MMDNDQKVKKLQIHHHHNLLGLIHRCGIHDVGNPFGNLSTSLFIVFKRKEVRPVG
jgi:hypothetical protein